jgi:RimJ/RimL family protein N-acetyltransferase
MHIETKSLIIRDFTENDIDDTYKYLQDNEVMKYVEPPFSLEQTKEFILEFGCKKRMVFALEEKCSASVIGHVIFHPYDEVDEYEIGWILRRCSWGKGYALEVSQDLIQYAFHEMQANRVIAETVASNQGALAVIKRLGMVENDQRSGTLLKLFELNLSDYKNRE